MPDVPRCLRWAREIQALAQTGRHYAANHFERERSERLLEIAAEMASAGDGLSLEAVEIAYQAQPGYVTPKVDVRAAVIEGGQLLLVQETADGGWTLPGGWADVGETPRQAVEREVREESGLQVRATRLVGVYDANRLPGALTLYHAYKLVFLAERLDGDLAPSEETLQVRFFPMNMLPEPLSAYRTTPRHIQDALAATRDASLETVFD